MNKNSLISMAIPTFNRAEILDIFFRKHIELFKKFNITVIISDNASTDNTAMIVKKWQQDFPLIEYHCNEENLGFDKNFVAALNYSKSTYTWLMGDHYYISTELMTMVLSKLEKDTGNADVCIVNLVNMITKIESKVYNDQNELLSDLGTVMTSLSNLIFHQKVIKSNSFSVPGLDYIHFRATLLYINNINFNAIWISDFSIEELDTTRNKIHSNHWTLSSQFMNIIFVNFIKIILSLPKQYTHETKEISIKSFGEQTGFTTFKGFIIMRMRGHLTIESYNRYKTGIGLMSSIPTTIVCLISFLPRSPLKLSYKVTKFLYKGGKKLFGVL